MSSIKKDMSEQMATFKNQIAEEIELFLKQLEAKIWESNKNVDKQEAVVQKVDEIMNKLTKSE